MNSIQLPKRNPIILLLYAVLVMGMFSFIIWTSLPYDNQGNALFAGTSSQSEGTADKQRVTQLTPLNIAGIQQVLDLRRPLEPQYIQLWNRFESADLISVLNPQKPKRVYLVFGEYSDTDQTVSVVLGYPNQSEEKPSWSSIDISPGTYLKQKNTSVIDVWSGAEPSANALLFRSDFEIYQLDDGYKLKSQTAFLSVAQ